MRRCGVIDNETTVQQRPYERDLSNYMSLY